MSGLRHGPVSAPTVLRGTARDLDQEYADLLCAVGIDAEVTTRARSPEDWCQWARGCDWPASVYLDGVDPWTGQWLGLADRRPEYCHRHGLGMARRMVEDGVEQPTGRVWRAA